MKNSCITKKVFFIGILMMFSFLISSCGVNMDTKLVINDDFTGYREITCTIDNMELENFVYGDIDGLELIIRQNIPEEMSYKITKDKTSSTLHFYIEFKTTAEYKNKIAKILNRDTASIIAIRDNMFIKGTYISEDFNSKDLLAWLSKALIANGVFSDENSVPINNQSYKLVIGKDEKVLEAKENNNIFFSDIKDSGAERVNVSTRYIDNQFVREIALFFQDEAVKSLGSDKIIKFMEEKSKAKVTKKEENMVTTFTVTIKGKSIDEVAKKTSALIGGNSITYTVNYLPGFNADITSFETFDFSNIISIDGNSNTIISTLPCQSPAELNYDLSKGFSLQNNDDKTVTIQGTCGVQPTIVYTYKNKVTFSNINVTTDISKRKHYTRSIEFYIPTAQNNFYRTEYENMFLSDKIDKNIAKFGSNLENNYIYTWAYSAGSIEKFNEITSKLFKNNEDFSYEKQVMSGKVQFTLFDNLNFKGILSDMGNCKINYNFIPPLNTKSIDTAKESRNSVILNLDDVSNYYSGAIVSDKIDVNANVLLKNHIFLFYLLAISLIVILIIMIEVLKAKKRKKDKIQV